MNEKRDADSAALYRLDADFTLTRLFGDMTISNGLAWSPDGRTMYHSDTPARTIRAFDYDAATGTPSRGRTFAQWSGETERPDGGATDSAGHYWGAFYGGGKLVQLSPTARWSPSIRCPRCARRCARSAAPICARCT